MAVGKEDYKDSQVRQKRRIKVPKVTLAKVELDDDDKRTRAELLDSIEELFQNTYHAGRKLKYDKDVDLDNLKAILTMLVLSAANNSDDIIGATQAQVDAINLNAVNISRNASDLATFISNISISNNKVGIGTTSPSTKLHIEDSSHVYSTLQSTGANTEVAHKYRSSTLASSYYWWTGLNNYDKYQIAYGTSFDNAGTALCIDRYGNVGIGTTSPGELLEVYKNGGDVAIKVHEDAGTHEAKLHLRRGGSDWELINNNDLAIESEGTELFRIKTSGNVGIGTTSPSEKLEVSGKILATGGQIRAGSYLESYPSFSFADDIDTGMFSDTANQLEFVTGGSSRVTINSSGNVGIGTTSPGYRFVVNSYSADTVAKFESTDSIARLELKDDDDAAYVGTQNNKAFIGMEANATGTNNLIVTSDGNVGIGTTSPSEKLEVDGNVKLSGNLNVGGHIHPNDENGNLSIYGGNNTTNDAHILLHGDSNYWGSLELNYGYDATNSFLKISQGSNEHLRITNGGKVGIGTTSPAEKLEVDGNIKVSGNLDIGGSVQKQIQVFPMNFVDDLGTDKHFMPFVTANEQTANYQEEACMVMPADGRVVSVTVHYAQMHGAASDITIGIETSPCGQAYTNSWTIEETETISASADDDHHVFHFAFDNAKHFESTDKMALSIQQSVDLQNSGRFFWVTAVIEYDWSTFLGGTSAEYPTTP